MDISSEAAFLYQRCKEFTWHDSSISEKDIDRCVSLTSEKLSVPKETISKTLVGMVEEIERECILSKGVELKDYQLRVIRHLFTNRGVVVAFDVGKGKTLTAVAAAICLTRHAQFFKIDVTVYIITPTSLQENFKKEMRKFGVDPGSSNFKFYTIVGFVNAKKRGEIGCENALLIIDEGHNLRKDYRMEFAKFSITSEEAQEQTRALEYIRCAADAWKVMILTATPVYNRPHDVVNLAAMVRGENPPLTAYEFGRLRGDAQMFQKYFGCMFAFEKTISSDFPTRKDEMVYIEMNPEYYTKYMDLEDRIKGKKKVTNDENVTNTFMVKLRKATNNLSPCLKCREVMNIVNKGRKTIIYSQFISSGIELIKKILDQEKIPHREITGKTPKKDRQEIVQEINDPNGPKILLITGAGGEGLDLKGIRDVILVEKGWTVSVEEQVIGRAVRYKSHNHLPPEEQNVTVHHLLLIKPEEYREYLRTKRFITPDRKGVFMSADLYLFRYNRAKEVEANIFRHDLEKCSLGRMECPKFESKSDIFYSDMLKEARKIDIREESTLRPPWKD